MDLSRLETIHGGLAETYVDAHCQMLLLLRSIRLQFDDELISA